MNNIKKSLARLSGVFIASSFLIPSLLFAMDTKKHQVIEQGSSNKIKIEDSHEYTDEELEILFKKTVRI